MPVRATRKDASKFFLDGTIALAKMEHNGLRVNRKYLEKTMKETEATIKSNFKKMKEDPFYKDWYRMFGAKTNIDSVQQIGKLLTKQGHKTRFKTEKGNDQWNEEALSHIDLPFLKAYNENRKLKKAHGTYLTGILRETDSDGFLHPSYNLAGWEDENAGSAKSYRSTSADPNFQNWPIRNPVMSKLIRPSIISRKGTLGVEQDFSQIEVRVSACYNFDPVLIKYIKDSSTDMHKDMACEIFMLKPDQVTKKGTRDASKNIFVFPEFYGSYYVDVSRNLWEAMIRRKFTIEGSDKLVIDHLREKGITKLGKCDPEQKPKKGTFEHHIAKVEDDFWNKRFKVYTEWKKKTYSQYLKTGYIDMHTGFRCEGIYRRNQVLNLAIQGSAFHCLLWSIIQVQKWIDKYKMKTVLTGQIHDCFLADSPPNELQDFLDVCREIMTEKIRKAWSWIIVPLETEVDIFDEEKTWLGKTPWVKGKDGIWASKA